MLFLVVNMYIIFFKLMSILIGMVVYIDLTFPTEYAYYKYIYICSWISFATFCSGLY